MPDQEFFDGSVPRLERRVQGRVGPVGKPDNTRSLVLHQTLALPPTTATYTGAPNDRQMIT